MVSVRFLKYSIITLAVLVCIVVLTLLFRDAWKNFPLVRNVSELDVFVNKDEEDQELYAEMLSVIDSKETLGGYILMTSRKDESLISGGYVYDVAENIVKERVGEYRRDMAFLNSYQGKYLAMGDPVVTAYGMDGYSYNPRIFILETDSVTNLNTVPDPEDTSFNFRARLPRWSPAGTHFTYNVLSWPASETAPDFDYVAEWSVYLSQTDKDFEPIFVTKGYGSQWSGNHIVYLKPDGIYGRVVLSPDNQISVGPEHLLHSDMPYVYGASQHLNISQTGDYLVLPQHYGVFAGSLGVYKIDWSDQKGPSAKLVLRVQLDVGELAFWPVFSPGGRYISMQVLGRDSRGEDQNRIAIYDLMTKDFVQTVNINDFNFDLTFNTEWEKDFLLGEI